MGPAVWPPPSHRSEPGSEATTKIENAKEHHEKSLEIPKSVDEKKNQPLQNSSLFEINHTRKFRSLCWMCQPLDLNVFQ